MKKFLIIPAMAMLLSIGSTSAMAQNNPQLPHGAQDHRPPDMPSDSMGLVVPKAAPTIASMPGGIYHLGNGYLSCPETLPITNGQPNLRGCNYIKDVK